MPLIFSVIPLGILFSMRGASDVSGLLDELGPALDQLRSTCGNLGSLDCAQFLILQQFMALFLMMPAIIPVTIAAYSIVGEKNTHTLEPLLATPITTGQLLTGKALAAAIPAVVAFNHFARQIRVLTADMENFSAEFLNIAERHFI